MLKGHIFVEMSANTILDLIHFVVIIMVKIRSQTLWDSLDCHAGLSQVFGRENPALDEREAGSLFLTAPTLHGLLGLARVCRKIAPGFLHPESAWLSA